MKKKLKSSALKEDKPENSIFFIQDNPNYKGLFSYSKTSRFNYLDHDPLYKFPTCNNQRIPKKLQINECLNPASINTPKFYNFLQEKSPFSNSKFIKFNKSIVSDSQDEGVPKNSINNISLNSEYVLSNNTSFNLLEEMERNKLLLSSSYISSVQNTSSLPEKAELSINILNEQILKLENSLTTTETQLVDVTAERDYYKNLVEQLQSQNTNKSRLQERDDWKSLVESIQKDRARLTTECEVLESKIEELSKNQPDYGPDITVNDDYQNKPMTPSTETRRLRATLEQTQSQVSPVIYNTFKNFLIFDIIYCSLQLIVNHMKLNHQF